MESIEFIQRYPSFVRQIKDVIKPEFYPITDNLNEIDPHDLITPGTWFPNENSAFGFVWSLFLMRLNGFIHPSSH